MLLNCGVGEDSWESLGLQGDPTSPFWRRSALGFLWKEWCQSWNSSILATSCEELTHWKRLWCWEGLGAGGEGDNRGWDGWVSSWTRWTWVWVNSGKWWWTGRPGMLRFMGSQRVGHAWVTELNLAIREAFPAPWSSPVSCLFISDGQSIGASASASVLPVNIQSQFPLGLTGWISLQSKGLSRVFSNTTVQKHQFFGIQSFLWSDSHICTWLLEKP